MSKLYMKNSNGEPSASLTMAMVSFILVTAWLVFWVVGTTFGLHIPAFDATVAMGYMTPLLGLYFGRRWTDGSSPSQSSSESDSSESSEASEPTETVEEEVAAEEEEPVAEEPAATPATTSKSKTSSSRGKRS